MAVDASDEFRALLRRGASSAQRPPPVDDIRARGRRRRRRKHRAAAVVPVVALAVLGGAVLLSTGGSEVALAPATPPGVASPSPGVSPSPVASPDAGPSASRSPACPDVEERAHHTAPGGIDVRLEVEPAVTPASEPPDAAIVNDGDVQVTFVTHTQVDRWEDGAWVRVRDPVGFSVEIPLDAGESTSESLRRRSEDPLVPGCHRILRWVYLGDDEPVELSRLAVITP